MKKKFVIASIAVAASMPASAMVKEYSFGVGVSETKGKIKTGSFSGYEPTLNLGLTFNNNIMMGVGVTATTSSDLYQSKDIDAGHGNTTSSIKEELKLNNAVNFRLGYQFENDTLNITPYAGVNGFSYKYNYAHNIDNEYKAIKDKAYVPFIGVDLSLSNYPALSFGVRVSDKETITEGVELKRTTMLTIAANI
ncbi:hypothetical protein FCV55_20975 [Vibrio sp. F13]|uniref:hypothetical protein n=1 Tax=Vibrio sp. F13 TaxID=2070777 RepID=UPI0010BD1B29|nr:hypothetical protein [Vibrio sp. F13]TKF64252.1 hypothetical protein FCV55_20975 [Vibrio sp. F13]